MKNWYLSLLLCSAVFIASGQNHKKEKINTKVNKAYKVSRKAFYGTLTPEEYKALTSRLSEELNMRLPDHQPLLIHYTQYGTNCIAYQFSKKDQEDFINNIIRISSEMCKEYNTIDFFVYNVNYFSKDIVEKNKNYILDSGFFADQIFTLHENCEAFYILKPSGDYMKYYGEDYATEVKNFFEKK